MAYKISEETSVDAITKDLFCCTICFDSFRQPRMLPCLHSFCEECLSQHVTSATGRDSVYPTSSFSIRLGTQQQFKCPQCREVIQLPEEGVQGFRQDFRVKQVKDAMDKLLAQQNTDVCAFCKVSGTHRTSMSYCMDCCKRLCSECSEKHSNLEVFKEHMIQSSKDSDASCSKHPKEQTLYLCVTCASEVCPVCVMSDEVHKGHNIKELESGLQEYKLGLHKAQLKLQDTLPGVSKVRSEVEQFQVNTVVSKQQVELEIRARVEEVKDMLQKSERHAMNTLTQKFNQATEKQGHTREELEQLGREMELLDELSSDVLEAPTSARLLEIYKDIPTRIYKMLKEFDSLSLQASSAACGLEFRPSTSKVRIGKVRNVVGVISERIQATKAQVLFSFGSLGRGGGEFNCPRDVCVLTDETIIVADCNNDRLQRFHMNGLLINTIADGGIRPWGVAALQDGTVAVTDNLSKRVRIFTPQGKPLRDIGHFLCPCGVTQDNDGNVLVTDFFSTFVYVMSVTGLPLREFSFRSAYDAHTCGVSRLAVTPDSNIVVSDVCNRCVKMFTRQGTLLWKTDPVNCPQGVAVFHGTIYAADALHRNVVEIDKANGKNVGELLSLSTLSDPTGLSISSGHLIVTQLAANTVSVLKLCAH